MRLLTLALVLTASIVSAQGIVIPHDAPDAVPDFCASAGMVTANETISGTVVRGPMCIPAGVTVTLADHFDLTVDTLIVHGALVGGSPTVPISGRLRIADRAITLTADPAQYGTGIIGAGTVKLYGIEKTTFLRLAVEPKAGDMTLTLVAAPAGWQSGDRLMLPDTRHLRSSEVTNWAPTTPQWETPTVASVNGAVVALTAPLAFAHPGARDATGAVRFLPHVGNLSRSIVIGSPAGAVTRGHTMFTARADVDIRYARFEQLGRTTIDPLNTTTNKKGRYPLHMHHLMGPAAPTALHQFTLIGNAIDGGDAVHRRKWGIAIHDSHYGLIKDNVVYNMAGASVMFEDGSESFNVVDANFAVRSVGQGDRLAVGVEGGGFWFKGPNNYVRNNVAANVFATQPEAAYGFKFFLYYLGTIKVPKYQGADTHVAGQFDTLDGNAMPIRQFEGNEVYGATQGMTYWWVNSFGNPNPALTRETTTFKNLSIWNVYNIGVYHYPSDRITFDGLTILGSYGTGAVCCGTGWFGSDYAFHGLTIKNADIQGMRVGINPPMFAIAPLITIEDSTFRNEVDISTGTMWNVGGLNGPWANLNVRPRSIVIRNSTFGAYPGRPRTAAIRRTWNTTARPDTAYNPTVLDEIKVYRYNGAEADHFKAYYAEQATQDIAGGLAPPDATTRADILGIVATSPGETPPPVPCTGDWTETVTLVPAVCDATQQQIRTVTQTFTQTGGDVASCPASPVVTVTNVACTYTPPPLTLSLAVTDGKTTCKVTVSALPPDATGGWGVQFTLNGANLSTLDTSAPYTRTKSGVTDGSVIGGTWTKAGTLARTIAAQSVECP
jgi:hypothetical protein